MDFGAMKREQSSTSIGRSGLSGSVVMVLFPFGLRVPGAEWASPANAHYDAGRLPAQLYFSRVIGALADTGGLGAFTAGVDCRLGQFCQRPGIGSAGARLEILLSLPSDNLLALGR